MKLDDDGWGDRVSDVTKAGLRWNSYALSQRYGEWLGGRIHVRRVWYGSSGQTFLLATEVVRSEPLAWIFQLNQGLWRCMHWPIVQTQSIGAFFEDCSSPGLLKLY